MEEQRQRRDDHEQPDELSRFEQDASIVGRIDVADLAIIRLGRHRRRPMPAFAVRDALSALQRGRMAELGTIPDPGVDIHGAADTHEGVLADGQRSGVNVAGLRPVAEDHRFLAQDRVVADRYEVRTHGHGAAFDDGVFPKPGAEKAQIDGVQRVAAEKNDRGRADQGLDDPEPVIAQAPDRKGFRFPASHQQPLGNDGETRHAEEDTAREQHAA